MSIRSDKGRRETPLDHRSHELGKVECFYVELREWLRFSVVTKQSRAMHKNFSAHSAVQAGEVAGHVYGRLFAEDLGVVRFNGLLHPAGRARGDEAESRIQVAQ